MDPFKTMQDWKSNMDHFFGEEFWTQFEGIVKPPIPQINLYKSDNEISCIVNIPGMKDVKSVDVLVDYAILEIRGIITIQAGSKQLIQEEILQGTFERKIELPFPVRSDKINATYQNGLLYITLYRLIQKESKKNKIPIRVLEN
ncbi:Hsp20/alpha crystallin family protein [Salirhabdus sp. Marseille-P4669]|uniref:Hsp20/alpha crystallin family protein n=1 Tax=Salirhabdus sp. Marseille-P4669 TaxID=2042310 RepID=UPI000C7BC470|nr:Hsp20/alpha crystallin family protein [Salirhabdus sp. Marseille-P4669]